MRRNPLPTQQQRGKMLGMATEDELADVRPRLLGMIDEARIVRTRIPRPDPSVVAAFLAVTDLASTVSDALDRLGIGGAVPASVLRPVIDGGRVVGPAITLRYEPLGGSVGARYQRGERALLADRDLYGVGQPGDVGVFHSSIGPEVSVMGGLSATWAKAVGIAACIIEGGVRDVATIRELGQLVWSSGRTPITGRQRVEAVEINGTISLCGIPVRPGDLIAADDTGVCIIPQEHISDVLQQCQQSEAKEAVVTKMLQEGRPVADIVATLPLDQW
jgi:regulator of RNase E activity RraA